jgi:membrane associated rhomboid family serine protease
MIPLHDHNPTTRPSIVVPALIALNVVVFLFWQPTFARGGNDVRGEKQAEFAVCHAAIPFEVTHGAPLAEAKPSALDGAGREFGRFERQACPHKSAWLAILTSMFLHASFLHIAGNMLFLFIFGNNVEDALGRVKFIIFYLLCGLFATLAQTYVSPNSTVPMVGASGAIAGVLGAYIVLYPRAKVLTLISFFVINIPAVVLLGFWFALQIFQGVGSSLAHVGTGVAYMAHVGGFIADRVAVRVPPATARARLRDPVLEFRSRQTHVHRRCGNRAFA